jgi:hypothetical protein
MVLFLVYVTIHELNMLIGDGELYRLFFRWSSSEAKFTRRQRIRLLTRLNRLTQANPIEAFSERNSPAHAELLAILHQLASRTRPGSVQDAAGSGPAGPPRSAPPLSYSSKPS